jgi:predicted nucleic acid-binding protein
MCPFQRRPLYFLFVDAGSLSSASAFIDKIKKSKSVRVFWVEEGLFEKALEVFQQSERKSWSFTDCTSFALMKDLLVPNAFTFDSHFREAGLQILP